MNLVEIVNQAARIEEMLIENGGELTPEIQELLSINEVLLPEKVDKYNAIIERMDNLGDYYEKKVLFYERIYKSAINLKNSLKDNMKSAMLSLGVEEMKGEDVKFKLSKTNPRLIITDEKKIADEFLTMETKPVVNKDALKDHLKQYGDSAGAHLEDSYSLRVYPNK